MFRGPILDASEAFVLERLSLGDELRILLGGGIVTLEVAAASWLVSTVVGLALAVVGRSRHRSIRLLVDFVCVCLRGIPQLVFLYIVFYGLPQLGLDIPGLAAAVVALGVTEAGFSSEVFRASFTTVNRGALEAGSSLGLSRLGVFRYIEWPLLIRFATPPLLNTFVALLKLATFASAAGVGEVLFRGQTLINSTGQIAEIGILLLLMYLVFTIPLTRLVGIVESRMRAVLA